MFDLFLDKSSNAIIRLSHLVSFRTNLEGVEVSGLVIMPLISKQFIKLVLYVVKDNHRLLSVTFCFLKNVTLTFTD